MTAKDMKRVVDSIQVGSGTLELTDGNGETHYFQATEDGGTLSASREIEFQEIDETIGRVIGFITGEEANFQINSLETDLELLRQALGHGTIEVEEAAGDDPRKEILEFGGTLELDEYSLKYTMPRRHKRDLNIIIELYRVVAATNIEPSYTKTEPTTYSVVFEALNNMGKDQGKRLGKITIETEETHSVTFEVTEEGTANGEIEGATVTLNSMEDTTDASGEATFEDLFPDTYEYLVTHEDYDDEEGEVEVVDEDVTVQVEMSSGGE